MKLRHAALAVLLFGAAFSFGQTAKPPAAQRSKAEFAVADTQMVWLTPKGKTYHIYRDCIGLERSSHVLESTALIAEQHGLTLCGICAHRHHSNSPSRDWAKPEAK